MCRQYYQQINQQLTLLNDDFQALFSETILKKADYTTIFVLSVHDYSIIQEFQLFAQQLQQKLIYKQEKIHTMVQNILRQLHIQPFEVDLDMDTISVTQDLFGYFYLYTSQINNQAQHQKIQRIQNHFSRGKIPFDQMDKMFDNIIEMINYLVQQNLNLQSYIATTPVISLFQKLCKHSDTSDVKVVKSQTTEEFYNINKFTFQNYQKMYKDIMDIDLKYISNLKKNKQTYLRVNLPSSEQYILQKLLKRNHLIKQSILSYIIQIKEKPSDQLEIQPTQPVEKQKQYTQNHFFQERKASFKIHTTQSMKINHKPQIYKMNSGTVAQKDFPLYMRTTQTNKNKCQDNIINRVQEKLYDKLQDRIQDRIQVKLQERIQDKITDRIQNKLQERFLSTQYQLDEKQHERRDKETRLMSIKPSRYFMAEPEGLKKSYFSDFQKDCASLPITCKSFVPFTSFTNLQTPKPISDFFNKQ